MASIAVSTVPKPVMMTVSTLALSSAMLLEQLEAAHAGHLQIADDEVVAAPLELAQRRVAVLDGADDIAFHGQKIGEDLADDLFVIDDQDARRFLVDLILHALSRVPPQRVNRSDT